MRMGRVGLGLVRVPGLEAWLSLPDAHGDGNRNGYGESDGLGNGATWWPKSGDGIGCDSEAYGVANVAGDGRSLDSDNRLSGSSRYGHPDGNGDGWGDIVGVGTGNGDSAGLADYQSDIDLWQSL